MNDETLRKKVKMLKATEAIDNYREVAELLEVADGSFYNWLRGYYNLGSEKKQRLITIIADLTIPT
jgi:succinate dehydrogenase flavin-adding protein (antitoxin of CptAB toxin-antitoxin module)